MRAKLLQTFLGLASRCATVTTPALATGRLLPQAARASCSPLVRALDAQHRRLHVLPCLCRKAAKYRKVKRGKKPKPQDCYKRKKPPAICMAERCVCLPGTYVPPPRLPKCNRITKCPCRVKKQRKRSHHKKKRRF